MTAQTNPHGGPGTEMVAPCPLHETPEPPLNIRVSVFFDGTGNNRYNTEYRRGHRGRVVGDADHSGSYRNELSNVARLCNSLQTTNTDTDHHIAVYVEGIGTRRGVPDDDIDGMARGVGPRGVVARVQGAFLHLLERVAGIAAGRPQIDRLWVDCFGFSRGAAAARHMVHLMLRRRRGVVPRLAERGFTVGEFAIPFVGLYDTVGHLGVDFTDDTEELHLDAIRDGTVQQVVQLAAGDEHRLNFPLTDIQSAGSRGRQIFLPGAHSDVGGGYNDISAGDMLEDGLVLFNEPGGADGGMVVAERCMQIKRELVALGWYTDDELTATLSRVVAHREGISHTYSYVPLRIMADRAAEKGLVFQLDEYSFAGDALLTAVHAEAQDNHHDHDHWLNTTAPRFARLRHGYLHYSSHYTEILHGLATAHEPQRYSAHSGWADDDYNLLNGRRRRLIMRG